MIYVNNHVPTKYEIRLVPVISVLLLNFPETLYESFQVQVDTVKNYNVKPTNHYKFGYIY